MDRPPGFHDEQIAEDLLRDRLVTSVTSGHGLVASGAFDTHIHELQRGAERVRSEASAALHAWITARSLPAVLRTNPQYAEAMDYLGNGTLFVLHKMLSDGALLKAYRLSGPDDGWTLPRLLQAICEADTRQKVLSKEWRTGVLGVSPLVVEWSVEDMKKRLERLERLVPISGWKDSLQNHEELGRLRNDAKTFRDKYLAHFDGIDLERLPSYETSGRLIELTCELASDCVALLKGSAPEVGQMIALYEEQAADYWRLSLVGPLAAHTDHLTRNRST